MRPSVRSPSSPGPEQARRARSAPSSNSTTSVPARRCPTSPTAGTPKFGEGVNVGAGTIFANYDGTNKWPTRTSVTTMTVGRDPGCSSPRSTSATTTSTPGSTIVEDVPAGGLAVARGRQHTAEGLGRQEASRGSGGHGGRRSGARQRPGGQSPRRADRQARTAWRTGSEWSQASQRQAPDALLPVRTPTTPINDHGYHLDAPGPSLPRNSRIVRFEESVRGADAFVIQRTPLRQRW